MTQTQALAKAPDLEALTANYLAAVGEKQFDRLASLLHPDLEFTGPNGTLVGRTACMEAFRRLGPILARNDLKRIFVDGHETCALYDFVTDTPVGTVPCVEWIAFEGDKLRQVKLVFDRHGWPSVLAELKRRAAV